MPLIEAKGYKHINIHFCTLNIFNPKTHKIRQKHKAWSCFVHDGIVVKTSSSLHAKYLGRKLPEVLELELDKYVMEVI